MLLRYGRTEDAANSKRKSAAKVVGYDDLGGGRRNVFWFSDYF